MKEEEEWEGKIMKKEEREVGREEEGKAKGKIRRKRRRRGGGGGMEVVEEVKCCQFVKTHLGWPVVAGATQEVEGVQKIPLHPINHPKTVCLIHVFLWG